ncbi:MAG: hypothetical protein DRP09_18560 [Candidatus Thorarchaeota archaeon]|nr:MAG: hypothetical protein DRP09_18560 [Candidatus Thorarchaeota archaeon]
MRSLLQDLIVKPVLLSRSRYGIVMELNGGETQNTLLTQAKDRGFLKSVQRALLLAILLIFNSFLTVSLLLRKVFHFQTTLFLNFQIA